MTRILYITMDPSPFQLELTAALKRELGDRAELQVAFKNKLSAARSHWNRQLPEADSFIPHERRQLFAYLDQRNPDLVIYPEYRTAVAWHIRSWAASRGRKLIAGPSEKLNEYDTGKLLQWGLYRLHRWYARGTSGIIAIGNNALRKFQQLSHVPVVNIPYTFDMQDLLQRPRRQPSEPFTFLISGRLEPFRDPLYNIRLFARLRQRADRSLKLLISGKGSLYNECLAEIDRLGIADAVEWRNEFNHWKEIHDIYFDADALLCMQRYSGWGLIIQEAMAAGMLVVSDPRVEAADQLIINGYNGLLLNRDHPGEVERAILDVLHDQDRMTDMGQRARESVTATDIRPMTRKMIAFFGDVLGKPLLADVPELKSWR